MIIIEEKISIKEMPRVLRPRERLWQSGPAVLSDSELLAVILRTGTKEKSVLQLSEEIIIEFGSLKNILLADVCELATRIKGIGQAKAIEIKAALELGRRVLQADVYEKKKISCAEDVFLLLSPDMRYLDKEYFKIVLLDTKNNILGIRDVSMGTLNASLVHPREVFKLAIRLNSASLILVHNHPSGDPYPSKEDIQVTEVIYKAGKILGIPVLDHVIIGDNKYLSFQEKKMMAS